MTAAGGPIAYFDPPTRAGRATELFGPADRVVRCRDPEPDSRADGAVVAGVLAGRPGAHEEA